MKDIRQIDVTNSTNQSILCSAITVVRNTKTQITLNHAHEKNKE